MTVDHAAAEAGCGQFTTIEQVTTRDYRGPMKVVGIKQLKARLSEYIRLAKAGETVLVTECAQRKTERSLWISRSGGDLLIKFLG